MSILYSTLEELLVVKTAEKQVPSHVMIPLISALIEGLNCSCLDNTP
jgi:hypothetical protein